MHAPLLVRSPHTDRFKPGTRVKALTEFIDIYPSLCELTGLEIPGHVQGSSFVSLMENPAQTGKAFAISRCSSGDTIRTDSHRYAEYSTRKGEFTGAMLFDHRTDSAEDKNVVSEQDEVAGKLAEALRQNMGRDE